MKKFCCCVQNHFILGAGIDSNVHLLLQIVEEFIFSMNVIFSPRCCTTTKSSEQSISLLPAPSRRKCHWSPRDALNHRLRTKGNLLENKFSTSFNTISSLSSVRALVRFVLLCVFSCYPSAALCVRSPTRSGPCLSRVYSNYETISHEEWTGSKSSNNEMMLMMMKQRRERERETKKKSSQRKCAARTREEWSTERRRARVFNEEPADNESRIWSTTNGVHKYKCSFEQIVMSSIASFGEVWVRGRMAEKRTLS